MTGKTLTLKAPLVGKKETIFYSLRQNVRRMLKGDYLPCYVLHKKPFIVAVKDRYFTREKQIFLQKFAKYPEVHMILQLGWQHETPEIAEPLAAHIHDAKKQCPQLSVTVLANSPKEVEVLTALGIKTVFCHQNAFLDESRYKVVPKVKKEFDALYIARIAPFKRHYLAKKIESIYLIGDYKEADTGFMQETMQMFPKATHERFVLSTKIFKEISRARCGLCLSKEEGAMFVSAEYMLCGIPVVNTKNIGGRDYLLPEFAVKNVEDTPEAVAQAVQEFREQAPDPQKIRDEILKKMYSNREVFVGLLNEILAEAHRKDPSVPQYFRHKLPHKLGTVGSTMPWVKWMNGIPR